MLQRDALIIALKARGFVEVPSKSKRFVVMEVADGSLNKFFIGKSGALRYGRKMTRTFPISDSEKNKLLKEGGY